MNSIVEAVARQAELRPHKVCIADKNKGYTYAEIWEKIQNIAQKFINIKIEKGDRVLVECSQDFRFLVCNFACELIGAIFVPVEYKASLEKVNMILEDTDAKLFLYKTEYDLVVKKIEIKEFFQVKLEDIKFKFLFPLREETAEILYTTGTTGKAKGIEITNGNNIAIAENIIKGTKMKPNNVELIPLPLSHSHGLRTCYANLLNGSTIVLSDGVSHIKSIFEMINLYKVTAIDLSPSAVLILLRLSKGRFFEVNVQMDYIQIGTAILQEDTKKVLISGFPNTRLYNFYGSTESGRTCVLDFSKERDRQKCIGKPTINTKFIVTDENRKRISSSKEKVGLLASAGSMNMKGYWKQPELTKQVMQNEFFYTDDIGYIDEEGFIYILGRKDDIINCGGIKISPDEIEESVKKYKEIIDCACVPKEDKVTGQTPKVFVVVYNKEKFQKKELIKFLEKYIDSNKIPKDIEVIDEIPRTYNGKIQRTKLQNQKNTII